MNGRSEPVSTEPIASMARRSISQLATNFEKSLPNASWLKARWITPSESAVPLRRLSRSSSEPRCTSAPAAANDLAPASRKERAAIHCESLAGDKVVLDQEQDGLRDVVAAPDATDGDVGGNARLDQRFAHLCVDQAGCDGVHRNALGCEFQSIVEG